MAGVTQRIDWEDDGVHGEDSIILREHGEEDHRPIVATLRWIEGKKDFPIRKGDSLIVGRGKQCDISINIITLSETHAEIYEDEGKIFIKDIRSSNGTFVENLPPGSKKFEQVVKGKRKEIHNKCKVKFGTCNCQLDIKNSFDMATQNIDDYDIFDDEPPQEKAPGLDTIEEEDEDRSQSMPNNSINNAPAANKSEEYDEYDVPTQYIDDDTPKPHVPNRPDSPTQVDPDEEEEVATPIAAVDRPDSPTQVDMDADDLPNNNHASNEGKKDYPNDYSYDTDGSDDVIARPNNNLLNDDVVELIIQEFPGGENSEPYDNTATESKLESVGLPPDLNNIESTRIEEKSDHHASDANNKTRPKRKMNSIIDSDEEEEPAGGNINNKANATSLESSTVNQAKIDPPDVNTVSVIQSVKRVKGNEQLITKGSASPILTNSVQNANDSNVVVANGINNCESDHGNERADRVATQANENRIQNQNVDLVPPRNENIVKDDIILEDKGNLEPEQEIETKKRAGRGAKTVSKVIVNEETPPPKRQTQRKKLVEDAQAVNAIVPSQDGEKGIEPELGNRTNKRGGRVAKTVSKDIVNEETPPPKRQAQRKQPVEEANAIKPSQEEKLPAQKGRKKEAPIVALEPINPNVQDEIVKVMFTGLDIDDKMKENVRKIGATLVDNVEECTHLITADNLKRTPKLLIAINSGVKYIVRLKWLNESVQNGKPIDIDLTTKAAKTYVVVDQAKQNLWKFDMIETLSLKRGEDNRVFKGLSLYITDGVCGRVAPPMPELANIVQSGGGYLLQTAPTVRKKPAALVVISEASVVKANVSKAVMSLVKSGPGKGIYTIEFLFQACLRQTIDYNENIIEGTEFQI